MNLKKYMIKNHISIWVIETVFKVKFDLLSENENQKILEKLISLKSVDSIEAEITYLQLTGTQS